MTWKQLKQLADDNAIFIENLPDDFMRGVYAAQSALFALILTEILDELETDEENNIENSKKNRKIIFGLSGKYNVFITTYIAALVTNLIDYITHVIANNTKYYNAMLQFSHEFAQNNTTLTAFDSRSAIFKAPELETAISESIDTINARLGLTEAGTIIKNGFIDNIYNDTTALNYCREAVYKGMITGAKVADLKTTLQEDIEGIIKKRVNIITKAEIEETIKKGNPDITRAELAKEVANAEAAIETDTASGGEEVVKQGLLGRVWSPVTNDVFTQVDRTQSAAIAEAVKIKWFIYGGTIVKRSRAMCIKKCNKVFNTKEAENWINETPGPIAVDPETYDPVYDMGGINCRHSPLFITDELYSVLVDEKSDLIVAD